MYCRFLRRDAFMLVFLLLHQTFLFLLRQCKCGLACWRFTLLQPLEGGVLHTDALVKQFNICVGIVGIFSFDLAPCP